jgi:hypothetical protein
MGRFPFGWVRGMKEDNWQILWDSETKILYARGVISKKVINIGHSPSWQEAKALADRVLTEPLSYLNFTQPDNLK